MAFDDGQERDIHATLAISWDEARAGSSRVVNLPGGRVVTVAIPAGTQSGAELRLPGQGNPGAPGEQPGDLVLRVSVIFPQRVAEQRWDNPAMPTEAALQRPLSSSATQAPTEYIPPGPLPSMAYEPNASPTEAVAGPYPSPQSAAPQAFPRSAISPQAAFSPAYGAYPSYAPDVATPLPAQVPRKRSGVVTLLVLLIVLVLIAGSAAAFYLGYYQPNQARIALTQTAQNQVSGTGQALQSATGAAASSTAQAQTTVQALQSLYTQVTGRTPTLDDSMSGQSGSQWEVSSSPEHGTCGFSGGSYHSVMPQANVFQPCFATVPTFSNFAFQVQMTIVQGDAGGVLFRANKANDQFYLLSLGTDGSYQLYLYVSNQGSQARLLLRGTSTLVQSRTNEITVIAQGNVLSFYLNKQYVASVNDATYASGMIGVFGESRGQPTDAAFRNIKAWSL